MKYEIEKITTDNPLLDEIVYNCKLMISTIVLKNEEEALKYETLESLRESDMYILAYEGKGIFKDFTFDADFLRTCSFIPPYRINEYAYDNNSIPNNYREELMRRKRLEIVEKYVELNDYYRKLNGLPPYGTSGIHMSTLDLSAIESDIKINTNQYLHEASSSEIETLESAGIIDTLRLEHPELVYLNYLGENSIDLYRARKADKFGILRVAYPQSTEVYSRFTEALELNRRYILKTVYSEAYKFMSDYYDNFMMILIVIQSFVDCIIELPEYLIRKDVFDIRTAKYIFESNGVKYFDDIPLKYQLRMVKNLNKLLKYKSTTVGIMDICSLFGFDNIEIFKYYILKDKRVTSDGKYIYQKTQDPETGELIEDPSANYELKFLKVPMEDIADNYIKVNTNILRYDDVTLNDKYWNGPYSPEYVKKKILEKEFNIELSKYISIDTVYELTEMSFELPYFINMIMFNDVSKDKLMMDVPILSTTVKFNLVDIYIYLYALMHIYLGVEDLVCGTITKTLSIKGFNFQVDLPALHDWLIERGETLESLGVQNFDTASNGIVSFTQLLNIFVKNKGVYEIVKNGMINANTIEEYRLYKKIYDSYFITDLTWKYYNLPEDLEERANYTYTDFLKSKDTILYDSLVTLKSIQNVDVRNDRISTAMNSIIAVIEEILDTDILDNIFSNIPTVSVDYVKLYMYKIIDFFKSYKVQILDINTIYKFDDKLDNRIYIIDGIDEIIHTHSYAEVTKLEDKIKSNYSVFNKDEYIELKEKLYTFIDHVKILGGNDDSTITDVIDYIMAYMNKYDDIYIYDKISNMNINKLVKEEVVILENIFGMIVSLVYNENIEPKEIYDLTREFTRHKLDMVYIRDDQIHSIVLSKDEYCNIIDERIVNKSYEFEKYEFIVIEDITNETLMHSVYKDKIRVVDDCYIERTFT